MAAKKRMPSGNKKDFSKEAMYRKIMPSISTPIDLDDTDSDFTGYRESFQDIPQGVPFNLMELAIRTRLIPTMEKLGACTCEKCRNDAMALALNALPAVYSTSDPKGMKEKLKLVRDGNEVRISGAIIRAVQTVMSNPRH